MLRLALISIISRDKELLQLQTVTLMPVDIALYGKEQTSTGTVFPAVFISIR
jgi:hypothetical protein